ncbi:MAG TPA: hypothetical protein VJS43_17130 [Candidatus Acidoferrales bacterium]|nr:hypothetical protein [Candidatus Acidoferrales bacterium]
MARVNRLVSVALSVTLVFIVLGGTSAAQAASPKRVGQKQSPLVKMIRDTGFVQVQAPGFNALILDEKLDAYWLTMAAIAVNPELTLHKGANGRPDTVTMSYPRDIEQEQLLYSQITGE